LVVKEAAFCYYIQKYCQVKLLYLGKFSVF
jgi:hypothetical protein